MDDAEGLERNAIGAVSIVREALGRSSIDREFHLIAAFALRIPLSIPSRYYDINPVNRREEHNQGCVDLSRRLGGSTRSRANLALERAATNTVSSHQHRDHVSAGVHQNIRCSVAPRVTLIDGQTGGRVRTIDVDGYGAA